MRIRRWEPGLNGESAAKSTGTREAESSFRKLQTTLAVSVDH